MIVDAHCHAWPVWPYDVPAPAGDGRVDGLIAAMDAAGIDIALIVAARLPGAEGDNEWIATQLPGRADRLRLVADLDSFWSPEYHRPYAPARLDDLCARLDPAGVTHYLADTDDGWLDGGEADEVLAALAERALPLSLHARPAWHAAVLRAAARHPRTSFVLHHFGHVVAAPDLTPLARRPNVSVKASGAYYVDDARLGERVRAAVDAFGPERVLWGSDHPVADRHGIDPSHTLAEVRAVLSPAEQELVLGGAAERVFGGIA